MSDEGATTVGSIVGRLKLDSSDWMAKLDMAEAKADTLREHSPEVKVTATVGEAIAKLDAVAASSDKVAAAQRRLSAAESASDSATAKAILAQMRLEEVQNKRSRTAYQVAAAEEALAQATRRADSAAEKAVLAEEALARAKRDVAAAALEEAAGQEAAAKSTDNAGKSMGRIQAILTAIVALGPGLIPIAAFAVGAGGALTAMMGVGVLAILGIRNQLKSGSADANDFAGNLGVLKADISQLEAVAARGVLDGFSSSVEQIDRLMPNLSNETALYSRILGGLTSTSTRGLLAGWEALQPLIIDVSMYLLQVTNRMANFAEAPGMRQFVTYAQQSLPGVEQLLNSLVAVAFHLLGAFAPWGNLVVDVLTGVANAIDAIPVPVLSTMIELALGGSLAFKAWTSIPGMLMSVAASLGAVTVAEDGATVATGALGAAIDFMEGPIGWVVAGIGALVAVLAASAAAQHTATTTTDAYAAALQQDNGVIGENVRLQAAKNLQDAGAFQAAKLLGISTNTLTSAATGNAAAQAKVAAQTEKALAGWHKSSSAMVNNSKAAGSLGVAADTVRKSLGEQEAQVSASVDAYNAVQTAIGGATISTQAQYDAVATLAAKYGMSLPVYQQVAAAQQKTKTQAQITTAQLQLENDAATLLTNAFTLLNGGSLGVAQAQTGLASANHTVLDSFKQNKTVVDGNSVAAIANQQALQGQVSAAQQAAEAIGKQTGSSVKAIESYKASKKAIEDQLRSQHQLTPAVQKYIDQLYDLKNLKVPKTKIDADTAAAAAKLRALRDLIASIHSKNITVGVDSSVAFSDSRESRAGGGTVGGTITGGGTSTSDSVPVNGSVGEEITRASRAAAYRPVLKAINNGTPSQIADAARSLVPAEQPATSVSNRTTTFNLTQINPVHTDPVESARSRFQSLIAGMQVGTDNV